MGELLNRPNFFIVGAPKSGTTSLYEYLEGHPDVLMSAKKEPNYFSVDLFRPRRLSLTEYLDLFSSPRSPKRIGEASATYIYSECAPKLIREFSPEARIIVILRNPVDMIYSLHAQHIWNGRENILDFEEALAAEPERKSGLRLPPFPPPVQMLLYRERGNYFPHVKAYIDEFGRDKVLVLVFEKFIKETATQYAEVCRHLSIDAAYRPDFLVHNANKTLRSARLRELPTHPIAKRLRKVLPKGIKNRAKDALLSLNTKIEKRAPMRLDLREQLQQEYADSVAELSDLLGNDLTRIWSAERMLGGRSIPSKV